MRKKSRQSTFRCATWLIPDTAVVNVSAVCTPADAVAGGTPMLIRMVLENLAEGHAERTVYQLCRETDESENEER